MRVAVVTHYWSPHVGGIERVALLQAQALARAGHEVTVFTSRLRGDAAVAKNDGVTVRRFRCVNSLERRLSVPVPLMAPSMLVALFRYVDPRTVVIAHGHVYIGSVYAALASRRAHAAFVVVQHNPFVDYGTFLNRIQSAVDRSIGRRVLHFARLVACVSEHTADHVLSIAPRAAVIVGVNGVDTSRFRPLEETSKVGASPRYVLTVRRLVPRNGVDLLLEAWVSGGLGERAELLIVGVGPEEARLRSLAQGDPSVRFLGAVDDDELAALHRGAEVFVLPTRSGEGYGLVAAEALASGVPVITTSEGRRSGVISDGRNGIVLAQDDAASLSAAISMLLTDHEQRDRLADGARQTGPKLDWAAVLEGFVHRVESLAA
ncbi:MAG TPA: glycosyltransferase family 4 protein [Acidimicrobiales bacterium]|nr:glycosyltransferase family 4 protein [Acidimicrobiales bacterium]